MQALMNVGSSHEVLELEVGLLGHGADGPLEDLALPLCHSRMPRAREVRPECRVGRPLGPIERIRCNHIQRTDIAGARGRCV